MNENTITITYTVYGYDEAGETSFDMDVSDRIYDKLSEAEDDGEFLDSDFISENMKGLHKRILKAIRENMEEESWNPDDGTIEMKVSGIASRVPCVGASHEDMLISAEDDDIEYNLELLW